MNCTTNIKKRILILFILVMTTTFVRAETGNCFKQTQGRINAVTCDHNCNKDKTTRFNAQGRCSVCGHLTQKQLDFLPRQPHQTGNRTIRRW